MAEEIVRAAIPGVFYRRPDPASPPFVEDGDAVEADTVIGLVEVMKQFQEVVAGQAGVVVSFVVENEGMVEAGDALVRLEVSG